MGRKSRNSAVRGQKSWKSYVVRSVVLFAAGPFLSIYLRSVESLMILGRPRRSSLPARYYGRSEKRDFPGLRTI